MWGGILSVSIVGLKNKWVNMQTGPSLWGLHWWNTSHTNAAKGGMMSYLSCRMNSTSTSFFFFFSFLALVIYKQSTNGCYGAVIFSWGCPELTASHGVGRGTGGGGRGGGGLFSHNSLWRLTPNSPWSSVSVFIMQKHQSAPLKRPLCCNELRADRREKGKHKFQ